MTTEFLQQLYLLVGRIPYGKVATYGQLAALAGRPGACRVVGRAMSRCPVKGLLCHRLVYGDGSLCREGAFPLPGLQRKLLQQEGVVFLPDGRVDLAQSLWQAETS